MVLDATTPAEIHESIRYVKLFARMAKPGEFLHIHAVTDMDPPIQPEFFSTIDDLERFGTVLVKRGTCRCGAKILHVIKALERPL